jgi:uncharacterized coiled-coil protein SlyX
MPRDTRFVPKLTFFWGGAFVGILLCSRRFLAGLVPPKAKSEAQTLPDLQQLVTSMESRLARQESVTTDLLKQLEARLEQLAAKVGENPSAPEIVTAVEGLLSRTMTSLDERLSAQAQSIDLLKSTVSQTDSLLERVLESIDSLEIEGEPTVVIAPPDIDNPPS